MDKRGFLGSILVACAAPAIVRADSLMRIIPRDALILPRTGFVRIVINGTEYRVPFVL